MKEIALTGTDNKVFADVLSVLLACDVAVYAMAGNPGHVMVEDDQLIVSRMNFYSREAMREAFEGYHDVIMTYDDNLKDAAHNDFALKTFSDAVTAVREAGVSRLIVVAGQDSESFYVSLLKRIDDIDWVFISTESDYPGRTADELIGSSFRHEAYVEYPDGSRL